MKQWKWDHDCRLDFSRRKKYHHQVKRFFFTKSFLIRETFPACSIPWNTGFFSVSTYVSNLRRKCVLIFHSLWSCSSSGSLAQVGRWWSTHVDARFGIIIILTGAQRKEGNVVESLIIRKLGLERMEWGKFQDMKIHVYIPWKCIWSRRFVGTADIDAGDSKTSWTWFLYRGNRDCPWRCHSWDQEANSPIWHEIKHFEFESVRSETKWEWVKPSPPGKKEHIKDWPLVLWKIYLTSRLKSFVNRANDFTAD